MNSSGVCIFVPSMLRDVVYRHDVVHQVKAHNRVDEIVSTPADRSETGIKNKEVSALPVLIACRRDRLRRVGNQMSCQLLASRD